MCSRDVIYTHLFIQWRKRAAIIISLSTTLPSVGIHVGDFVVVTMTRKVGICDCIHFRAVPIASNLTVASSVNQNILGKRPEKKILLRVINSGESRQMKRRKPPPTLQYLPRTPERRLHQRRSR